MTDNAPMVTKAAEAIARILVLKAGLVLDAEICDAAARAAIEAMREPTEAMLAACEDVDKWVLQEGQAPQPDVWRAMIDAALKERKA